MDQAFIFLFLGVLLSHAIVEAELKKLDIFGEKNKKKVFLGREKNHIEGMRL